MANQNLELALTTTDGAEYTANVIFSDMISYDLTRAKLGFPSREESEFAFMGLVAYHALKRTGQIKDIKAVDFLETIQAVEPIGLEEEEDETFRDSD